MPAKGWGAQVAVKMERNWINLHMYQHGWKLARCPFQSFKSTGAVFFPGSYNGAVHFPSTRCLPLPLQLPPFFCGYRWGTTCSRASGSSLTLRGNDISAAGSSVSSELHSNLRWHIRKTRWSDIGELRRSPTALESRKHWEEEEEK